jgi:hypothetical protein
MKLTLQHLPEGLRGGALKYLAPDAAASLLKLEEDFGPLDYKDFWRGPDGSLLARRIRRISQLPGYSAHNFGLAMDLDLEKILEEKKISYEDLLYLMAKRGWYCGRRDGQKINPEAEHFNFLGEKEDSDRYLYCATGDPVTWQRVVEEKIYELYGDEFTYGLDVAQEQLRKLRFYSGEITGKLDMLTREAVMAFQRAWDMVVDGQTGFTFQRTLAFVSADLEFLPNGTSPKEDQL